MHIVQLSTNADRWTQEIVLTDASVSLEVSRNGLAVEFTDGVRKLCLYLTPGQLAELSRRDVWAAAMIGNGASPMGRGGSVRETADELLSLDNREIQELLRDIDRDTLIDALWYFKNVTWVHRVADNMTLTAARALIEDISARWHGVDPDHTDQNHRQRGERALKILVATFRRFSALSRDTAKLGGCNAF